MIRHMLPLSLLGCTVIAGCGNSAGGAKTPLPPTPPPVSFLYNPAVAHVPACAHAGKAKPLPAAFPRAFPFPAGTDISSSGKLSFGVKGVGIKGYVPSSSFGSTVNFFKTMVPRSGFKLVDFEVDSPHDSEGVYRGYGRVGQWQLHALAGCKGAMAFAASSEPPSAKPGLHG